MKKLIILCFISCISTISWGVEKFIDIHLSYGKYNKEFKSIIVKKGFRKYDFVNKIKTAKANLENRFRNEQIKIRFVKQSNTHKLVDSLQNRKVLGALWFGPLKAKYWMREDRKVVDYYFFADSKKKELSKHIFRGGHNALQFVSLTTSNKMIASTEKRRYFLEKVNFSLQVNNDLLNLSLRDKIIKALDRIEDNLYNFYRNYNQKTSYGKRRYVDVHLAGKKIFPDISIFLKHKAILKSKNKLINSLSKDGVYLHFVWLSTTEKLIDSLQNPNVVGVVWAGHSRAIWSDKDRRKKESKLLNTFLVDAKGHHIPKNIFLAAHNNLQFVSLITCSISDIVERYHLTNVKYSVYKSDSMEIGNSGLGERSFIITETKKAYLNIINKFQHHYYNFQRNISDPSQMIKVTFNIKYRDLKSKFYCYEVILDGQMVGVFWKSAKNIFSGKGEVSITAKMNKIYNPHQLIIRPDDPHRIVPETKKPVDDILIDIIEIVTNKEKRTILRKTVHIGDDDKNVDEMAPSIRYYWPKNKRELERLPRLDQLIIDF